MAYTSVNLTVLQNRLIAMWESSPFWTSTEATNAINEALKMWNLLTGQWRQRVLLTTVANQVYYSVPDPLLLATRLEWQGKALTKVSISALDDSKPNWEGQTIASNGVPTRPMMWAPVGLTKIAIWPADTVALNSITVDGIRKTPVLVTAGDYVDIGEEELDAVLGYALHVAAFKGDRTRWKQTEAHLGKFFTLAASKNARLRSSAIFRKYVAGDQEPLRNPIKV